MNVICPKCGRTFQAPDDAPDHKLRCSECGALFVIQNETPSPPEPPRDATADRLADTDLE